MENPSKSPGLISFKLNDLDDMSAKEIAWVSAALLGDLGFDVQLPILQTEMVNQCEHTHRIHAYTSVYLPTNLP